MRLIASLAVLFVSFLNLDCRCNHDRKLNLRQNFFDYELLRATAEGKNRNVMISPASVKSTLIVLLAGADGDTAREIEGALRVSSVMEELREQLHFYLRALRANTTKAVLQNANGIFISNKLKVDPKYEALVKLDYLSELTALDFSNPNSAATVINNWVSDNTNGLIPFIVEPVQVAPQTTDLIVANALYFKSSWLHAFDARETKSSCFYRNGDCNMVAMMDLEMELNYAHIEDLTAHAVELPYKGKRYSMIILVPLVKDGLDALIRDLPYVGLPTILDLMHPEDVTLSMPRFTVNYNEDLVEALRKLHITCLLSNKSNLSKIFKDSAPSINSFHHKVFMSVDETGTVAAASSAASVVPLIFNGGVEVRVDRPFVFFIMDNELEVVLFEGKIEEPSVLENAPVHPVVKNVKAPVKVPIKPPVADNRQIVKTVQSSNTKPETKSKTFVENFRSFFEREFY